MKGGRQGVGVGALELQDSNLHLEEEMSAPRSTDACAWLHKHRAPHAAKSEGEKPSK